MRTVTGVDVVTRGSSHVIVTLTDEGGRKQTFELTRLLAEHLSMAALCQEAAGGRRAPHPEESADQSGRGKEDRASE